MKKLKLALLLFYFPAILLAQDDEKYTIETNTGETKVVEVFRVTADKIWYWDENENKAFFLKSDLKSYALAKESDEVTVKPVIKLVVKPTAKIKAEPVIEMKEEKPWNSGYFSFDVGYLTSYPFAEKLPGYKTEGYAKDLISVGVTPKLHLFKGVYLTASVNYTFSQVMDAENLNATEPDINTIVKTPLRSIGGGWSTEITRGPYLSDYTFSEFYLWNVSVGIEKFFDSQLSIYAKANLFNETYVIHNQTSILTYSWLSMDSQYDYYEYYTSDYTDADKKVLRQSKLYATFGIDYHFTILPFSIGVNALIAPKQTSYSFNFSSFVPIK